MKMRLLLPAALFIGMVAAGCAITPSSPITTGSLPDSAKTQLKGGKPVVVERAARMHVFLSFKEKDCSPSPSVVKVSHAPARGTVSFKTNPSIPIQYSKSGQCIGKKVPGTAVYYTASKGAIGADSFSVTATSSSGQTETRLFKVQISE